MVDMIHRRKQTQATRIETYFEENNMKFEIGQLWKENTIKIAVVTIKGFLKYTVKIDWEPLTVNHEGEYDWNKKKNPATYSKTYIDANSMKFEICWLWKLNSLEIALVLKIFQQKYDNK